MAAWIGLIGAVIGGLIAAGAAWLNSRLQFRYQQERERKKLLLAKMQELYEITSEFKDSYTRSMTSHLICLVERRSVSEADTVPVPVEKLQMLVGLYAPKLQPNLNLLFGCRQEFSDVLGNHIVLEQALEKPVPRSVMQQSVADLQKAGVKLRKEAEAMQKAIADLSKEYI